MSLELYRTKIKPGREGWVYLIHAQETNLYKIGRTVKPVTRLSTLQRQSPHYLIIQEVFYTLDAVTDEIKLHQELARCRVRGEWFEEPRQLKITEQFYSYTNRYIQNDAKAILSKLGVDFSNETAQECLHFFCCETLEVGQINLFWKFIEKDIPLVLESRDSVDATSFVSGLLRGAALALYGSRLGEIGRGGNSTHLIK